jgi:tRNA-specific 2-thiouridylase
MQSDFSVGEINWLGDESLSATPQIILARIRSTRAPVPATISVGEHGAVVSIVEGEFGVSPGQAAVFYDGLGSGQRVLGGGFIAVR